MRFNLGGIMIVCLALVACGKPGESKGAQSSSVPPAAASEQNPVPGESVTAPVPVPVVEAQPAAVQASKPQKLTIPSKPVAPASPDSEPARPKSAPDDSIHVTFVDSQSLPQEATVPLPAPRPQAATPAPVEVPPPAKAPNLNSLEKELLHLLNSSRAQAGIPPLKFSRVQSSGTGRCIGSEGHSLHMGRTSTMSHDQFPQDICIRTAMSGENVGYSSGTEADAIRVVHKMMMDEGPSGGHYQNIMSANYNSVGLGFYYANGILWVTESFLRL